MRIFGCIAHAHIPKDERGKLDAKSKICIFLGYGSATKGYRLYDSNKNKILHSRDIIFQETDATTFEKEQSETPIENIQFSIHGNDSQDEDAVEPEPRQKILAEA